MTGPEKPAPFPDAPPDFEPAPGYRIWLTEPLGMIEQVPSHQPLTQAMTDTMVGPAYDALHRIQGDHPFIFVHDWAGVSHYEPNARNAMVRWPTRIGRANVGRMAVCISPDTSTVMKMAIKLGATAIGMAGFRVEITDEPLTALVARLGLRHRPH